MADRKFSSPAIAREMKRIYGTRAKDVKIDQRDIEPVIKYVMKIEEGHKKAASSKLQFR